MPMVFHGWAGGGFLLASPWPPWSPSSERRRLQLSGFFWAQFFLGGRFRSTAAILAAGLGTVATVAVGGAFRFSWSCSGSYEELLMSSLSLYCCQVLLYVSQPLPCYVGLPAILEYS